MAGDRVCSCANNKDGMHPILCIIPPRMLEHMIKGKDATVANRAMRTLLLSSRFAGRRQAIGGMQAFGAVAGTKRRTVYHANGQESLPGVLVRGEGDPATGDAATDEAYDGAGATYDFYSNFFGRN